MTPEPPRYTPHGPQADQSVAELLQRGLAAMRQRALLPVEAVGHYIVGAYARGEGWVALERDTWLALDTPHLFILVPDGFEEEARQAFVAIQDQMDAICMEAGYAFLVDLATESQLMEPEWALLAYEVTTARKLLWSYDGHDPLKSFKGGTTRRLQDYARALLMDQGPSLRELAEWSRHEIFGLHQGILRLAFIRSIEVITALGDAVLMNEGRYAPAYLARAEAMQRLADEGKVQAQLARLYRTAIALRLRRPQLQLPAWDDMRVLMQEVLTWSRHVAHAHFGAAVIDPVA